MNLDRLNSVFRFEPAAVRTSAAALIFVAALATTGFAHAASHTAGATPAKPAAAPAAAAPAPAAAPAVATAAAPGTCNQQATEKKLAGAAKNSFLSKCEREATERCEAAAAEKKLAGAARTGNVNKCVKEAVGG